uniref:Thrombospondin-like N-terminal domain-containing protein n=1 Tax=Branchiostoma floridae TaxID=7739 RepID=C3Y2Q5_BRAFL|eukprot:XP_002609307.1 hypothetical protein BRAFLDRAFT_86775 [Branchiostoma floridae]
MDIKSVAVRWIYHGRTRSDSTLAALLLAVLISLHVATIAGIELPEGSADLIDIFQLRGLPKGINKAIGFCENRPDGPDVAYRVSKDATLVVPTTELFPNGAEKTFPVDFSVLLTVKPSLASRSYLFTVIVENNVQFGVQLADVDWVFLYGDAEGRPGFEESPRFNYNVADGQWHRIAFSVQRNKVSMIMDCDTEKEVTMDLDRSPGQEGAISTDGMTALFRHFFRENVAFELRTTNPSTPCLSPSASSCEPPIMSEMCNCNLSKGLVQDIMIIPDPLAAYEQCIKYTPDCPKNGTSTDGFDGNSNGFDLFDKIDFDADLNRGVTTRVLQRKMIKMVSRDQEVTLAQLETLVLQAQG